LEPVASSSNRPPQPLTPLTERLFKLAGYSAISATSYVINVPPTFESVFQVKQSSKKMYIAVYIGSWRLIGLVDSGSDVTIMSKSLFDQVLKGGLLNKPLISSLTSFSGNTIYVIGQFQCLLKLHASHPGISITIHVIDDIPNIPTLLLGNNLLQEGLGTIGYTGSAPPNHIPHVTFNRPDTYSPTVYFKTNLETMECAGTYSLGPYEQAACIMFIDQGAPLIRNDFILITGIAINDVAVIPSRTDICWDPTNQCYVGTACILNLTDKVIENGIINAKIELINQYSAIILQDELSCNLRKIVQNHPLGREILASDECSTFSMPLMTVNSISALPGTSMSVNDIDFSETLYGKEPEYLGTADLDFAIIEPKGVDIPTLVYTSAEEAVQLSKFDTHIQPFLRDIFINKYPEVVSLHSLDAGNLSLTLGFTQLRLRKGESLPRSRRIFHVSPGDSRHLDDITDLLIKFNYIQRATTSPTGHHLYGMSSYLIPRAKPGCLGRLIIDYSPMNQLLESPASVIPEINKTLQFLKSKVLYSALDLRQAYLALRIDKESQPLTRFLTPSGSFEWLSLPTGAANSPAHFSVAIERIIHNKPVKDANGDPIFESPNVVKLERDVLTDTEAYFDDIMIASSLCPTYEETLKQHFSSVEKAVSRLHFHGAKLSVAKCNFAKTSICFLGWYVSKDYVIADPRRIQKVLDYTFPTNKKAMRAFLGLLNSLRKVMPLDIIKGMTALTPLTSSKADYTPTPAQREIFVELKALLTKEPLYCHLIDEAAEKYLFVDAATSSGVLGGVLAQRIVGKNGEKILPDYLNLEDPVHQIIYDLELKYIPCTLYTQLPIELPKPALRKTIPPKITPADTLLGYTTDNVQDSLFYSVLSVLALYNCSPPGTILELREKAVKKLKQGILARQLLDFQFNMNYDEFNTFLSDFKNGLIGPDDNMYLIHALALCLYRPIIIISSLIKHKASPVIHFHAEADRPPVVLGLYYRDNHLIFLPFYFTKNCEFKLDSLKGKINIVAYTAKVIPPGFESRSILDMEVFAILTALYSFQRFISGVKVNLLTDSRVLYYLFSSKVGDSSVKIRRWCLKLISDYPTVVLHFVKTSENLADFLTREGLPQGDLCKFSLKNIQIADIFPLLPQVDFTLLEWAQFVEEHPEYLTINDQPPSVTKSHVLAINAGLANVQAIRTPLEILRAKLSRSNIIIAQKTEFVTIYTKCLASEDFEYIETKAGKTSGNEYKLVFNLLMINKGHYRIYLPPSLVGVLLSLTHLLGHQGLTRMLKDMQSYYFPHMSSITKKFVSRCHPCFLTHKSSRKQTMGFYPVPTRAFEELMMDIAENLNKSGGYSHLLIMQCILTDFCIIVPLKEKTSAEISRAILNSVLQNFNVEKIHSDNGPGFRSTHWCETMAAFGIKIIGSSALHPQGRGQIERLVRTVKTLLQKYLASRPTLNWEYLPYIISKVINNTVSPKTGFRPQEMVFGKETSGSLFLNNQIAEPHYTVKNNTVLINRLSDEIKEMKDIAISHISESKQLQSQRVNKNRTSKEFKQNDIVFVLDRSVVEGNPQVLRTKYSPSPYVVVNPSFTTTLVKRIADGFTALYSNDDLKSFKRLDPIFNTLPVPVLKVLQHEFSNFINEDFATLTEFDKLELPDSLELFIPNENYSEEPEPPIPIDESDDSRQPQLDFNNELRNTGTKVALQDPLDEFYPDTTQTPVDIDEILSDESDQSESDSDTPGVNLRYGRRRKVGFTAGNK